MKTSEAVIDLGSNIGNKKENLKKAIKSISLLPNTEVIEISNFYETKPFGVPDKQDNYINCCIKMKTSLSPYALLGACLGIEASMGRIREFKNQSRIIDLDLLLYENFSFNSEELTVPHPKMLERSFVIIPLADLYPSKIALGLNFEKEYETLGNDGVTLIK